MTILIACDSFKDACSSIEACSAIADGLLQGNPRVKLSICPISDGGEGAMEIVHHHLGGTIISKSVFNPIFKNIPAHYLMLNQHTAFIEMARAAGLELLEELERNPMNTSTFGVGQLIYDAIQRGCKELLLTIGGSATNDLGIGMASALGWQFYNKDGIVLSPIGANMNYVDRVKPSNIDLSDITFTVLTDVDNVLYGKEGAAMTYGKQKGGSPESIELLDKGLRHMCEILEPRTGRSIKLLKGGGAAGGLGAGAVAFCNANLVSGSKRLIQILDLETKIKQADIIITGEGSLDDQTKHGKIISHIASLANKYHKQVIVFCGKNNLSSTNKDSLGISQIIEISDSSGKVSLEENLKNTSASLNYHAQHWAKSQL